MADLRPNRRRALPRRHRPRTGAATFPWSSRRARRSFRRPFLACPFWPGRARCRGIEPRSIRGRLSRRRRGGTRGLLDHCPLWTINMPFTTRQHPAVVANRSDESGAGSLTPGPVLPKTKVALRRVPSPRHRNRESDEDRRTERSRVIRGHRTGERGPATHGTVHRRLVRRPPVRPGEFHRPHPLDGYRPSGQARGADQRGPATPRLEPHPGQLTREKLPPLDRLSG